MINYKSSETNMRMITVQVYVSKVKDVTKFLNFIITEAIQTKIQIVRVQIIIQPL